MPSTFVIGGARSGKSAFAQRRAEAIAAESPHRLLMIATAEALDEEMVARIARHRAERGSAWRTIEEPIELPEAIRNLRRDDVAVIDCLTLWLSNLIHHGLDVGGAASSLGNALAHTQSEIILVSNEVGMGIVPENALARTFRDAAGRLNHAIADRADAVVVMFAGQHVWLKR